MTRGPMMPGSVGMTEDEQDAIWDLHVKHQLSAKVIGVRFGKSATTISHFLKKHRKELGVEVKIDKFRIERPIL